MTYLAAVLSLLTASPAALALMTLRVLLALHVAAPACYLIFRALGFQWDGLAWGWRVLAGVHELRRAQPFRRVGWAVGAVVMILVAEVV